MIARLVRLAQLALAAAGVVWIGRSVARVAREAAALARELERAFGGWVVPSLAG